MDSVVVLLAHLGPHRQMVVWYVRAPIKTGLQTARSPLMPSAMRIGVNFVKPKNVVQTPCVLSLRGSDRSVVPQEVVDSLYSMQPTLQITNLPTPVVAVMADGRIQSCTQVVSLDLELRTLAGLVSLRLVVCLIMAGDGDEFLLGSDDLKVSVLMWSNSLPNWLRLPCWKLRWTSFRSWPMDCHLFTSTLFANFWRHSPTCG